MAGREKEIKMAKKEVVVHNIERAKAVTTKIGFFDYNMLLIDEQVVEVSKMYCRMAGIVSCALTCTPIYNYLNVTLSRDKKFVAWVRSTRAEVEVFVGYWTKDFLSPEFVKKSIFRRTIETEVTYELGPREKMCELEVNDQTIVITYYWYDERRWVMGPGNHKWYYDHNKKEEGFKKVEIPIREVIK